MHDLTALTQGTRLPFFEPLEQRILLSGLAANLAFLDIQPVKADPQFTAEILATEATPERSDSPVSVGSSLAPAGPATLSSGSVTTAGDSILRADELRSRLGVTGQGVKVGVISQGVDHWTTVAADPYYDLPASITINPGIPAGSGDEGTALLEIIHDIAPDAELYFSGTTGVSDYPDAVNWLVGQQCDVIVSNLVNFGEL